MYPPDRQTVLRRIIPEWNITLDYGYNNLNGYKTYSIMPRFRRQIFSLLIIATLASFLFHLWISSRNEHDHHDCDLVQRHPGAVSHERPEHIEGNDIKGKETREREEEPVKKWHVDIPEYFQFNPAPCKWMEETGWRPTLYKQNYGYVINPADKCDWSHNRARPNVTFLILVPSGLANIERRETVRKTWLGWSIKKNLPTRTLFLLGSSSDKGVMDAIREEADKHGDIVQEDFIDAYYNLTLKTLMAFKWAATFCKDADYVMKMDDDGVLNVEALVRDLTAAPVKFRRNYLAGMDTIDGGMVNRTPQSKWCIPRSLYSPDAYPMFPRGAGYVFSIDVAGKLYNASKDMYNYPLDDVLVGLLLHKVGIKMRYRNSLNVINTQFNLEPFVKTEASLLALRKGYLIWEVSTKTAEMVWNATISNKWPFLEGNSSCGIKCVEAAEYLP